MRHGDELRGLSLQAAVFSPLFEGRFGRMFRTLPPFTPAQDSLVALADHMFEKAGADKDPGEGGRVDPRHNPDIPSGYTYLGQFVDHDEVLLGLLAGDQHSYLSEQPGFTPAHFLAPNGVFGMPELIRFAFG